MPAERTLSSSTAQPEKMSSLLGKLPGRATREPSLLPQPSPSREPLRVIATQGKPALLLAQAGKDTWGVI